MVDGVDCTRREKSLFIKRPGRFVCVRWDHGRGIDGKIDTERVISGTSLTQ